MTIRRAEPADAAGIATVHVRSWQSAYRGSIPQDHLDRLSADERRPLWEHRIAASSWPVRGVLVAETDGRLTGFAPFGPTRDKDADPATVAEVAALYLEPEAQGSGLGRAPIAKALDNLTTAGYTQVTLWVLNTSTKARLFYENTGWRSDGTVKTTTARGPELTEPRYHRERLALPPGHRTPPPPNEPASERPPPHHHGHR
ncbi:GNAT family N-acetyltransferase [Actinomadura parmotrematis]|uniref:GNAT family N-acetyltransferase n=1 Tax=Actinomadura parmotrematis TaxID=2864039 RepID=A0ABS7G3Q2_9ACTN|nr:GNAT family N-acetyltransferase [Actinomadura parmotrematis]MBW8487333.1 GNAT family N-acetyltransferase [Actinomadura parmotrematis]